MSTLKQFVKPYMPHQVIQAMRPARNAVRAVIAAVRTDRLLKKLRRKDGMVYLEFGPGGHPLGSPWIGIDWSGYTDLTWDLCKPLPFETGTIAGIYSSHVLEHFTLQSLRALLRECARVLSPGGFFLCAVPDAGRYIQACADPDRYQAMRVHVGASDYCVTGTPFDLVNMTAYMHGEHHTMFDCRFLCGLLQEAGFPHVRQREYDAHFDLPDRDWESLYAYAGFQDWEAIATAIKTSRSVTRMSGEPPRG